jgi:DNA primase
MIPEDVITQIRDAANIVEVIGQYVQLKKAGRNWKGLCPFHGEKTPSFNVQPEKGFFMCFGCQKKGDVFTFLMELEGKSFVEVAEQLAGRFGIEMPKFEESPELRRARGERIAMLELNKLATQFYRDVLADPKRGEPGRAYLAQRRVDTAITDKFLLGYAPAEWGLLADHLKAQRADMELAVRLGLVAHRPRANGFYDRNRDRLVCPVVVPGGDVVGFSSRIVGTPAEEAGHDPPPKYINSPESTVYKKSKLLFGLAQAREAIGLTKRVVLVEGNFDVISLHQAGFTEVVAPLGTALTPEQVNVLKRLAERVVLLYDGDRAGYKATMHALQLCVEADVEVQIASRPGHGRSGGAGLLSDGVDPDSLVAGGGAEQLREAVDRAKGGIEFFAEEVWTKARGNMDARARALEDAARLAAKVATPVKRDLIVGTLATSMQVDATVIRNAIARAAGRPMTSDRPPSHTPVKPAESVKPSEVLPTDELEVLGLLRDHPELVGKPEADKAFWLLTDARLQAMYSGARAGQSFEDLASLHLPPPAVRHVFSCKYVSHKDPRAQLVAMANNLEARRADIEKQQRLVQMKEAQRSGDHERARLLGQLTVAERAGDHEQIARIRESLGDPTRKQVD